MTDTAIFHRDPGTSGILLNRAHKCEPKKKKRNEIKKKAEGKSRKKNKKRTERERERERERRPRRIEKRVPKDPYRCYRVTVTTITVVEASTLSYIWLVTRHGSRSHVHETSDQK